MDGLNKFKILTVVFIAMFIFVVAAIYSNTKDASANKNMDKDKVKKEQTVSSQNNRSSISFDDPKVEELLIKMEHLSNRVEEVAHNSSSGSDVKCSIRGIISDGRVEELSADAALQEARDNERELVMTCRF